MQEEVSTDRRIELLSDLGKYMSSEAPAWLHACERAALANPWFSIAHIRLAADSIVAQYLQKDKLEAWVAGYSLPGTPRTVGIVMAANIPLVGFHDFLCGFVCGHNLMLKLSSRDEILLTHVLGILMSWEPRLKSHIHIAERLNGCDAYIATGSNNTSRYFEQYFGKYPHIIRKNRTSVAVLDGAETDEELSLLADDVYLYYGLGCRNVSQVCVPQGFSFPRLLDALKKHNEYVNFHKYKNNYDYHLAIYLLNQVPYMSNESLLMVENKLPFSAVSVLHYRFYTNREELVTELLKSEDVQAIIGHGFLPFGTSQKPALDDYADGVDTMEFLCGL